MSKNLRLLTVRPHIIFCWPYSALQCGLITGGRFEIGNFKTQKWVWMILSYLVENFFLVILRPRIFFFYEKFSKKNRF